MSKLLVNLHIQYQASGSIAIGGHIYHPGAVDTVALSHAMEVDLHDLVPEGYRIVPVEPTEAMIEAGRKAFYAHEYATPETIQFAEIYKAMVAAGKMGEEQ